MANANQRFEKLAADFRRDTGMMAPGKDQPAAMGGPSIEEREAAWRAWLDSRPTGMVIDLMMALKDSLASRPSPEER